MLQSAERGRCVEAHQVQGSAHLLSPDRPGSRGAIRRRDRWQAARKHYQKFFHSQRSVHAGRAPAVEPRFIVGYSLHTCACGKWSGTSSRIVYLNVCVNFKHIRRCVVMAIAKPQISVETQQQLRRFFEDTPPASKLLTTLRSRRVGLGYKIETGVEEKHPVTGRVMKQERGPLAFASTEAVVPLSETEQAILAWSAIGPNGMVNWDIAIHGGFHELAWLAGRTAAS